MINICIVTFNRQDLLRKMVESLKTSTVKPDKIWIIDHGYNPDKIKKAIEDCEIFTEIITLQDSGCAVAANWFLTNVPDERIGISDDVQFEPDTIEKLVSTPGDVVYCQRGGGFPCCIIRDSCVKKIGLFDETISPGYLYYEDWDYTRRMTLGQVEIGYADTGYIHEKGGSQSIAKYTIKQMEEHHQKFAIARANYTKKWGDNGEAPVDRSERPVRVGGLRPRLLWVGDAACSSGFARATHETLDVIRQKYDVTVLGINYLGDPHSYPYPIYACAPGGDPMGVGRLPWLCHITQPDIIVFQNDPWNIPGYIKQLQRVPEFSKIPVVVSLAVDGKNFQGQWLDGVSHTIFWTYFAEKESRLGGYKGSATVIPLGIDLKTFHPMDQLEARHIKKLPSTLDDKYIVGNVNRNQPRKRWDLTVKYFAKWVNEYKIDDALLMLHTAPTGDIGYNIRQLGAYYGVWIRLVLIEPPVWAAVTEEEMCATYNCFDVQISTTQGEGMGLTTLEGMACGIPQMVPGWSALQEITHTAAFQIPCTTTAIGPPYVNVIGGIADEEQFVTALDSTYHNVALRRMYGNRGLDLVADPRYQWPNIGQHFMKVLDDVLLGTLNTVEETWKEVVNAGG